MQRGIQCLLSPRKIFDRVLSRDTSVEPPSVAAICPLPTTGAQPCIHLLKSITAPERFAIDNEVGRAKHADG